VTLCIADLCEQECGKRFGTPSWAAGEESRIVADLCADGNIWGGRGKVARATIPLKKLRRDERLAFSELGTFSSGCWEAIHRFSRLG
jgi:hypothetical protein